MRVLGRLVAYGLVLAAAFGLAFGAGALLGTPGPEAATVEQQEH